MKRLRHMFAVGLAVALASASQTSADGSGAGSSCSGLPSHGQLRAALVAAVAAEGSGLNNHMWATLVNREGIVCAVAFSGVNAAAQWPGSRVISAQKANTATAFSLDSSSSSNGSGQPNGLALSTANLYSAVQPGGSLYGLQHSNPVDTGSAYQGPASRFGRSNDPLVGEPSRRRERVRRRPRPLQLRPRGGGRRGSQRRHVVRGPQHRVAGPAQL